MFKILMIEDNPDDAKLVEKYLSSGTAEFASCAGFEVETVDLLEKGISTFQEGAFDIVLLDLNLPDSSGVETFEKAYEAMADVPIIVLSGQDSPVIAEESLKKGTQDYLVKQSLNAKSLIRSLLYSIQRFAVQAQAELNRSRREREEEFMAFGRLAEDESTSLTAQSYGVASLKDMKGDVFHELVGQYQEILEMAMEKRAFKVDPPISEKLEEMAKQIGYHKGGPKDIIAIHTETIKKNLSTNEKKNWSYTHEGKFCLIELLGYLVSHYRTYSLGRSQSSS